MLSFFRRFTKSRVGIIVTFVVLGLIALAFAAADVTGVGSSTNTGTGSAVATVGDTSITATELRQNVQRQLDGMRREQPGLDMAQFVAGGGVEEVLERMVNGAALQAFGTKQGLVISKPLVDSELRGIPALQGPTGQFDQLAYDRLLGQQRLTDAEVRSDIAREVMAQHLTIPTVGASQVPQTLALPYASLLLEKRAGQIAFVPAAAMGTGNAPTDAELQTFYQRNIARYTVPERRVFRFARVTADSVAARAVPSEAEIAAAYKADPARFAATEKRTLTQVTVLDQAAASALAARVKAGTTLDAAARAAGLEPQTLTDIQKAAYLRQSNAAVADAVFGAAQGAVVGPVRGAIGFVVAKVDKVTAVPGRTLAEARGDLVTEVTRTKTQAALAAVNDALSDAVADNANIGELAADQKLTLTGSAPLTATGFDVDRPTVAPDPALGPIVAAAFAAEQGDAPTIVPTGGDGSFAVVGLDRVIPAAPRPLAQMRDQVVADFTRDRANRAARVLAAQIVQKVERGTPLAQAVAGAGRTLPAIRPLAASRAQLAANPRAAPAPLVLMFSMAAGTAKLLEAPDRGGWFVVKLDSIAAGDAGRTPGVVQATRGELGQVLGQEYVRQFTLAARRAVGVKQNAAALAALKAELLGKGASDPQ